MQRQGKERSGPDRGSFSLMSFYKYINIRKQGQTTSKKKFLKQVPRTGRCLFKPCGSNGCFYDVSTDGHLIQNGPVTKFHTSVTWIGPEIDMWPKSSQSESFTVFFIFFKLKLRKKDLSFPALELSICEAGAAAAMAQLHEKPVQANKLTLKEAETSNEELESPQCSGSWFRLSLMPTPPCPFLLFLVQGQFLSLATKNMPSPLTAAIPTLSEHPFLN